MPVKKDIVEANGEAWATKAETYIGNGPYKVTEFTQTQMTLEKNEYFYNADAVKSNKIVFAFNDDDSSLLTNYQNGSYLFIDSVPNDEIANLSANKDFFVEGQLGTYYVSFNVNDAALEGFTEAEKADIRKALGLMIDRNYVCEEIGQAGQVPAAGFVAMGLTEPDGKEFIEKNGPNGDGKGYYSVAKEDYTKNCDEAVALLKGVATSSGKFTVGEDNKLVGFPKLVYLTNEGSGHEAIAEYLQQAWGVYGIEIEIQVQEWATFLNTRKNGDYSVARNGWLGDYNDPISFLDMWITSSGNNDCQFGKGAHASYAGYDGKTWADSYDKIIGEVKTSTDATKRFELMHDAEDILMETGAICPIYYYTDIFMCSESIDGFFASPLGYKYFMYASIK
jgi:oligopeptide transport system substrate-binding protein